MLGLGELVYSPIVRLRNVLYDAHVLRTRRLNVPVVSIGNITTGGTGKTPVVHFLAEALRRAGMHPAILMRGYKRAGGDISDEATLLEASLADDLHWPVRVYAQADRFWAGREALAAYPRTDVLLLDDGLQHRQLARDFELVLIDATNAFGYGHVLPRGLLREPLAGLKRADAFVLTRSNLVAVDERAQIEQTLRMLNPIAPAYRAQHALAGLCDDQNDATIPLDMLRSRPFYACAGIGNPWALEMQLKLLGETCRGWRWFPDHHDYTPLDLSAVVASARAAGTEVVVVTEKDWAKISRIPAGERGGMKFWRLLLRIDFDPPGGDGLVQLVQARISPG